MPLDPYFSAGKLAWLLRARLGRSTCAANRAVCGWERSIHFCATGSGPGSRPIHRLRRAHSSARPIGIRGCSRSSASPGAVLPRVTDTAGDLGVLRHPSWPCELPLRARCVDQQAALAGAGCVKPGQVKATYGTGVFVLAHAGSERPEPGGGLLPTVAWQIDGRFGMGDRRGCVHRRGPARVAER